MSTSTPVLAAASLGRNLQSARKMQTGGADSRILDGETLAELAHKHQVAEQVIARLFGFMGR